MIQSYIHSSAMEFINYWDENRLRFGIPLNLQGVQDRVDISLL
jgi:hypothetical protein